MQPIPIYQPTKQNPACAKYDAFALRRPCMDSDHSVIADAILQIIEGRNYPRKTPGICQVCGAQLAICCMVADLQKAELFEIPHDHEHREQWLASADGNSRYMVFPRYACEAACRAYPRAVAIHMEKLRSKPATVQVRGLENFA